MKTLIILLLLFFPFSAFSEEKFSWSDTENAALEIGVRAKTVTVWETTTLFIQYAYRNVSKEIYYVPVAYGGANLWVVGTQYRVLMVHRPHADDDPFAPPYPQVIQPGRVRSEIQDHVPPVTVFPIASGETLELSPFGVCIDYPSSLLRIEVSVTLQRRSDPFAYSEDFQKHLARSRIARVVKTPSQSYGRIETGTGDEKPLDRKKIISPDWEASVTLNFDDQEKGDPKAPPTDPPPKLKRGRKSQ